MILERENKSTFQDWFLIENAGATRVFFKFIFLCFVLFVALFSINPLPASAQEAVDAIVELETDRGFGRIAITLPERTRFMQYEVSTDDNVLVLRFEEKLNVDLQQFTEALLRYVLVARQDPGGRVLRFALARGVRVNTMTAGEHLYIDFLPSNWAGENPAIPEEIVRKLEKRAEDALFLAEQNALIGEEAEIEVQMNIRVGHHPTFSRLVFSWNVPYTATFKRQDDVASITFNRLSKYDYGPLNADLPKLVRSIRGELGSTYTVVELALKRGAQLRSYRDGDEYIIDITGEKLQNNVSSSNELVIGGLPAIPDSAQDVSQTIEEENTIRELAELPKATPVEQREETSANKSDGVSSEEQAKSEPRRQPEERAESQQAQPPQKAQENRATSQSQNTVAHEKSPEYVDPSLRKEKGVSAVGATVNESRDALRVVFPFDQRTSSAIFRRGKAIWMVFKTDDVIDISALEALAGDFLQSAELIDEGDYKAVRVILPTAQLASAAIDDHNWVVSIGNSVIRASQPLTVARALNETGLFLNIPLEAATGDVVFEDPTVGDNIHVVVADPPSRGLVRRQDFVMLTVLPSTHAFAFVPVTSDVKPRITPEGVAIETQGNLNISSTEGLRASASGNLVTNEWFDEPFDVTTDHKLEVVQFPKKEAALIKETVEATDETRPQRYVDLAKFYYINDYAPEALANLNRAKIEQPLLENKRLFVLAKAAAQIKMGRHENALTTLSGEAYEKDQDAAVWRTIAAAQSGKWKLAAQSAALGQTLLTSYDSNTQKDFFLSAADAALELKDLDNAKHFLGNVLQGNSNEYHRGRYEILQGKLALLEGRFEDARFFFQRAEKSKDIRVDAEARLNLIKLDHTTDRVDNANTIDRYEAFVAVWRNDDLELEGLRELGKVLADEEEYRKAFHLVETAVISDNDSDITHALQDDMKKLFVEIFHGGKAEVLPAIDALSLYYDFRHLTPIGRVGDEIVRNLSRRLIDLDLLPQAEELLTHQVEKRLRGAAKARVAADLAVVELLDNRPHRALATLQRSRVAGLPATLQRQRRLVEAYALAELGRHDVALDLIDRMEGQDAERLKANINWDAKRWRTAGELLEKAHDGRWADAEAFESNVRLDIMRAAIAYSLAKDDFALNRLAQKFGQKMSESSDAAVFRILTRPLSEQNFDRDVAVDSILNIGTSDSFLQDYRRRYLTSRGFGTDA